MSSSESDEDYVPGGAESDPPSEEESDGEPEENIGAEGDSKKRVRKGGKRNQRKTKKLKIKEPEEESDEDQQPDDKELTEEEKKKKADSLWADFMKDTGFKPKPKENSAANEKKITKIETKPKETVTVTKVFEFAGEEVRINKEVPVDSAEARICAPASETSVSTLNKVPTSTRGRGRGLGGISSVLNQIGKKQKISTLEKSKLDWDKFKKEENIEEELTTYNKGKNGYLQRQDFLERADLRQFEKEKEIRGTLRRHRI